MSMEDNYNERLARFEEKYPMENNLVNRIAMTFNQIYKNVYSNSTFQGFGNRKVKFNVTKASDGSNTISMTEEGLFFLAAVAGVISRSIYTLLGSGEYEERLNQKAKEAAKEYVTTINPFLIQSPKRCSRCNLDNDYNANFVNSAGISYENKLAKANWSIYAHITYVL